MVVKVNWDLRKKEFTELPKERLVDFMEMSLKNYWTLQNQYIAKIERDFGEEKAIEFDGEIFGRGMEVQVWRLKKFFGLGDDIPSMVEIYKHLLFAPDFVFELEPSEKSMIYRVRNCPMQLRRKRDGQSPFACKEAGLVAIDRRSKAINPKMSVKCNFCPPDSHPEDTWCEWRIEIEE